MNEELQRRAIEAVARADYESWREHRFAKRWEALTLEQRSAEQAKITAHVKVALSVVADWCDEGLDHDLERNQAVALGWNTALVSVAEACRPVGEDQT